MKNNGKTAVITGASRGIGRAIALTLAAEGFHIAGIARSLQARGSIPGLMDLKEPVEQHKVQFLPVAGDISDIRQHREMLCTIIRQFGQINLLVNNAGIGPSVRKDILETEPDSFDKVLSVNLRGAFFFTQSVAAMMLEDMENPMVSSPAIVFITSISADASSTDRAEYCISKAGLSMAAKAYAHRLAPAGIRVFEIRPGIINTLMTKPVKEKYDTMIAGGLIPQQRWGQPEDVAKVVAAIARGDLDYSTGSVIEVSGGMNIKRL